MPIDLKFSLEEIDQKLILRLEGRLDISSVPLLERKIGTLGEIHLLLLDLSRLEYLSSAGLRLFLSLAKKLKAKKGGLVLFSLSDEVEEIIKTAGFDRILTIYPSEKEALQYSK